LKIVVRIINNDGNALSKIPVQMTGDLIVGFFSHSGSKLGKSLTSSIEIDIEMWRLQKRPVESPILNLVFPKELGIYGTCPD